MDDLITQNQLNEIAGNRIYLVVPEKVKAKTERYRTSGSVMTFETFFEDVLDPKMKHWKRDGVIL
jgi:hypothetical protein